MSLTTGGAACATAPDANERAITEGLEAGRECLEAALEYLRLGWSPLCLCPPDHVGVGSWHKCGSPGKVPVGPWKVYQEKAADESTIRHCWARQRNGNVGLALGPASGLVGVDIDGPDAEKELATLSGGDLPATLEFTSGKGRRLLYAIPEGVTLRTTHQDVKEKRPLSFLAQGSQTVMPPSRHASGRRYEWVEGRGPGDIEAAPAPAWLVTHLRADEPAGPRPSRRRPAAALGDGEKIPAGRRNIILASLAGSMRHRGLAAEAIDAALQVVNAQSCDEPLPGEEVRGIAASISRYPPDVRLGGDGPVLLSNYRVEYFPGGDGSPPKPRRVGRSAEAIAKDLRDLTGGWPRCVDGRLFAELLGPRLVWLDSPAELFAWAQTQLPSAEDNSVSWATGPDMVTQEQFLAHLRMTGESYLAVEAYPHEPRMPGHHYLSQPVAGGDGRALRELLDLLRPASDADRHLLEAFFLSLFWGGRAALGRPGSSRPRRATPRAAAASANPPSPRWGRSWSAAPSPSTQTSP